MRDLISEINAALETGFINHEKESNSFFQPRLVLNDPRNETKTLSYLISHIEACDDFWFSTAFLTNSGLACLHNVLKSFSKRNVGTGKILISDYLCFTQPDALKRISEFENIETKLQIGNNFHGKGYLFKIDKRYDLLIGSSNLTQQALAINNELNLHLSAIQQGSVIKNYLEFFNQLYGNSQSISPELLFQYEKKYKQRTFSSISNPVALDQYQTNHINYSEEINKRIYIPNLLQKEAMKNISKLRSEGENRALVVSATGTGKTVLAAFDVKQFKSKRMLFVVHRFNIAMQAMITFQEVFGSKKTMGMYSGKRKESNKDFIFSTIQTINKDENLNQFSSEDFDYIVIDETHRAGAQTYQKIIDYFNPDFLLGMTATPERTDGYDIFSVFNHNIGCEIRLHRAMEEELLCPFHYFGVSDISVEGKDIDDFSDFNLLVEDERVDRIIDTINEYGCDDSNPRGLIFCSRVDEAERLSNEFNKRGFKTISLSGNNSNQEREDAIEKIESDDESFKIDYIFTVDVFNEGIDIPKINQVIMLRPTQSAIVFVQQLGRGLRKLEDKEYLTVIDFIGNYENNYMIPIALYGDNTLNKDTLRKLVSSGSTLIPGCSTINFDQITKERIFESIDSAKLDTKRNLLRDYNLIKFRLGRKPMMMDFLKFESRNPFQYVQYSGSFYNFSINEEDETHLIRISEDSKKLLKYLSKNINNGIRGIESLILLNLLKKHELRIQSLKDNYYKLFKINLDDEAVNGAIHFLNLQYHNETHYGKKTAIAEIYNYELIKHVGEKIFIGQTLKTSFENNTFKEYLIDSVKYSLSTFERKLKKPDFIKGFIRYEKYSRNDVFRILNWKKEPVMLNIGGYKTNPDNPTKDCPIFINYEKDENIPDTQKYDDKFISPDKISTMSKSQHKTLINPEINIITSQSKNNIRLPLFIRKSDVEGKSFYYIGELTINSAKEVKTALGSPIVKFQFTIDKPVEESLYRYITKN
ncbi:MAG: DUF3427 domain-containing protein [Gammaproteobacteria bacterium]|jgi:superfamily II DNA or RNA helicase/HKD family nuclease|nr:DUF3427 domain-containing protein [Gammaproteobacteria bacterium]